MNISKRFAIGLVSLLCLMSSGCRFLRLPAAQPESSAPPASSTASLPIFSTVDYADSWCYQRLDDRLQLAYSALYAAVTEKMGADETVDIRSADTGEVVSHNGLRVALPQPLTTAEEAQQLYTAFTWDHPEFFFISNTYGYEGYQSEGKDYFNAFCLVFTMNAAERGAAKAALDEKLDTLTQAAPASGDAFATELYLHDALLAACTYDNETAQSEDPTSFHPNAFTAYGALIEGRAVCEGYARAMQLLMHRSGIPCSLVSGFDRTDQAPHMWNLITIDGRNYHLDPTWNDSGDQLRHTFFNLTTAEIERSHILDQDNIGVDTCTATEANFHRRTDSYLTVNDSDSLSRLLADRLNAGAQVVELRFSDEAYTGARFYFDKATWLLYTVNRYLDEPIQAYSWETNDDYGTITFAAR